MLETFEGVSLNHSWTTGLGIPEPQIHPQILVNLCCCCLAPRATSCQESLENSHMSAPDPCCFDCHYFECLTMNSISAPKMSLAVEVEQVFPSPAERADFLRACQHPFDTDHLEFLLAFEDPEKFLHTVQLTCLWSFCNAVQVPFVNIIDDRTIRWLCQVYLGYLPNDSQMANLPFKFSFSDSRLDRLKKLFAHMNVIVHTLNGLSDLYSAGYVHLMSRHESQNHVQCAGTYLLRISNSEVGKVVISTKEQHIYLDGSEFPDALGAVPSVHQFNGRYFVIYNFTLEGLRKFLKEAAPVYNLRQAVLVPMGASLDQITPEYSAQRFQDYATMASFLGALGQL